MSSLGEGRKLNSNKPGSSDDMSDAKGKWEGKPPPKFIAAIRDDDWKSLLNSILYLFHKKKLQRLELDILHEKVRNVCSSKIGAFIVEYYQDSILKKGMIVLRENIKEKKGIDLLERLADVWTQFYTNILPTVLAIFYPIQEQGIYLRSVTLVGFRDMVLLKTKIQDALEPGQKVASEIKQMLLVLASVHDSNPPNENYIRLEHLVTRVVRPYLGFNGLYLENRSPEMKRRYSDEKANNSNPNKERRLSRSQIIKEEVTRKLRRANLNETNNNKDLNHKPRFRLSGSSNVLKPEAAVEQSGLDVNDEKISYHQVKDRRWREQNGKDTPELSTRQWQS